ncbi:hypothetical protein [Aliarcobacter butzleri]|uniref:hypothetical protein n=1 Tax=Aliarcobacter butzleri TaxID=28197 RepID=UPI0021B2F472|nr:hypothetical protein [Aliarcobacter butzleri]MCT7596106.1 hypothetical protein [Aliarcobacter butzleri]
MRTTKILNKINEMIEVLPFEKVSNTTTVVIENDLVKYTLDLDYQFLRFEDKVDSDKNFTTTGVSSDMDSNIRMLIEKFLILNETIKTVIKVNGVQMNRN